MLAYAIVYHAEIVQFIFGGTFVEHSWLLPLITLFSTVNSIGIPVSLVAQYEEKASIVLLSKIFVVYCYWVKLAVPAPAIPQLMFGALICGAGLLIYVRTPAIASTDRQMLASVFHGKEAPMLQCLGLIKPDIPRGPCA